MMMMKVLVFFSMEGNIRERQRAREGSFVRKQLHTHIRREKK